MLSKVRALHGDRQTHKKMRLKTIPRHIRGWKLTEAESDESVDNMSALCRDGVATFCNADK